MNRTQWPSSALTYDWFRQHHAWLIRRVERQTGCRFFAEDIASEAFVQLLQNPNFLNIREPRAMLTTIAQRLLYEVWRRRDAERGYLIWAASESQQMLPSQEERALILESLTIIERVLDGHCANARYAFLCHQLDGLTHAEISKNLGVSVRMVQKYISNIIRLCHLATE
ncbi:sigma-70 family RNA polymerase sigma factor [Ralstonia pseudosolanacearum]|uniref:sigma-70 family RNA polymerase sigma factor n=1 Tax=Ralstonia pseudosolanacearum TaxID=1310165 RepID=UPI0020069117|nr:sigma-70 family RNA polymerase sigma factor [Ralstonia pseudosolanacearum]MCK4130372.1 sigma-70 family RNA polymerase sigma factor [Ralstonia pseudosolanacearum]